MGRNSAAAEWPAFDWLPVDCLPTVIQLALMLPPTEERLRMRLCTVSESIELVSLFLQFVHLSVILCSPMPRDV